MMNYDQPSYFGRPMGGRPPVITGCSAGAVRIAEDVVGQALIATLQLSLGRHFTEPVTDPNHGAEFGLGFSQCSMVFRIVWFILVERWFFISFAFKKHFDVHTYSCCVIVGSHTHTQDIGLNKSMHIHNLI